MSRLRLPETCHFPTVLGILFTSVPAASCRLAVALCDDRWQLTADRLLFAALPRSLQFRIARPQNMGDFLGSLLCPMLRSDSSVENCRA